MVSEVSAIEVASTTLRRPGGDGEMARSCSRAIERAEERRDVDALQPRLLEPRGDAHDLPLPRQEGQHRALLLAQRAQNGAGHRVFDALIGDPGRDSASRPRRRGPR